MLFPTSSASAVQVAAASAARSLQSLLGGVQSQSNLAKLAVRTLATSSSSVSHHLPQQAPVKRSFATIVANPLAPQPLSASTVHHPSHKTPLPPTHRVQPTPEHPVPATFTLANGQSFAGSCYGAPTGVAGEVVFTTALVGYPESLTDPSYAGQILVLTQPLAGNYGVPAPQFDAGLSKHYESARIHARAVVVQDYCWQFSHRQAIMSLGAWCAAHGVPLISGVDTRQLVGILRESGSTMGSIQVANGPAVAVPPEPNGPHLVASVSTRAPQVFGKGGKYKVAVMDYGVKHNILRSALAGNQGQTEVTLLPWDFPIDQVADQFDGILLSNGPGDPKFMTTPVKHVRAILEAQKHLADADKTPIFGICMGVQVLGMAAGMKTYKLKYGNRGHNQPCVDLIHGGKCVITSQNHGYCLDDSKMPQGWQVYFKNANDGSNEGIWAAGGRWKAVQFHPEAWGGPTDTLYMFDEFAQQVKAFHEVRVANAAEGLKVPKEVDLAVLANMAKANYHNQQAQIAV